MSTASIVTIILAALGIVSGLIGVIWALLNSRINRLQLEVDKLEIKHDTTAQRIYDSLDDLKKIMSDFRALLAGRYVTREDCSRLHRERSERDSGGIQR